MGTQRFEHRIVLLSTGFRMAGQTLFFSRARLYFDRIELGGWSARGQFRQVIALDRITGIEWSPVAKGSEGILLELDSGASFTLRFERAGEWRAHLERRLSWNRLPKASVPTLSLTANIPLKEIDRLTLGGL